MTLAEFTARMTIVGELLTGTAIITSVRATVIASICAMAYSVYATTCEAAARQVFRWIFSCDDGELDRVTGRSEDVDPDR